MNNNSIRDAKESKLLSRSDLLLLVVVLLLSLLLFLLLKIIPRNEGVYASVSIDGTYYKRWSLSSDCTVELPGVSGTNLLQIKDGAARVLQADCPDLICVHHIPISTVGERIVCLPNRIVITIEGAPDSTQLDALSQ